MVLFVHCHAIKGIHVVVSVDCPDPDFMWLRHTHVGTVNAHPLAHNRTRSHSMACRSQRDPTNPRSRRSACTTGCVPPGGHSIQLIIMKTHTASLWPIDFVRSTSSSRARVRATLRHSRLCGNSLRGHTQSAESHDGMQAAVTCIRAEKVG